MPSAHWRDWQISVLCLKILLGKPSGALQSPRASMLRKLFAIDNLKTWHGVATNAGRITEAISTTCLNLGVLFPVKCWDVCFSLPLSVRIPTARLDRRTVRLFHQSGSLIFVRLYKNLILVGSATVWEAVMRPLIRASGGTTLLLGLSNYLILPRQWS